MAFFLGGGNGGRNLRFWFSDPQKALPCASFNVFCVKIGALVSAVAFLKNPQKVAESLCAEGRMRRTETPKPIWIKFGMLVDIPDIVTYTNFAYRRLTGFWVAGVKFPLSH